MSGPAILPGPVMAAAEALRKAALLNNAGYLEGDEEAAARVVLEAAGPLIAAAQREADAQLMDKHGAHYGCYVSVGDTVTSGLRPFAALLRAQPPATEGTTDD